MSTSSAQRAETRAAIVSGGTSGIGRAVALRLARDGIAVTAFSDDGTQVERFRAEVAEELQIVVAQCDVRDAGQVEDLVRDVVGRHGGVDVLCHAAGVKLPGSAVDTPLGVWRETFDVNVTGAFLLTKAVLPSMVARGGGVIVTVGSPSGEGEPGHVAYAASKGALDAFSATVALEHLADHIRVSCVVPGSTRTGMNSGRPEEVNRALGRSNVAGRINEPEDVANAVAFLVSSDAATISGARLHVGSMAGLVPSVPATPEEPAP